MATGGCVRIGSGPQAELHALFISLRSVVCNRYIEFPLKPRVVDPMSLSETQQRFVARVMSNRVREGMTCGEVDPQLVESFE